MVRMFAWFVDDDGAEAVLERCCELFGALSRVVRPAGKTFFF